MRARKAILVAVAAMLPGLLPGWAFSANGPSGGGLVTAEPLGADLIDRSTKAQAAFADERFYLVAETDAINSYAIEGKVCDLIVLDVRKRQPDMDAVAKAVTTEYAQSAQRSNWGQFGDFCNQSDWKAAATDIDVFYFGRPVLTIRGGEITERDSSGAWNENELPDEANFNTFYAGLNFVEERSSEAMRAKLVRAIALGSGNAGWILAYSYGQDEGLLNGVYLADGGPREKELRYMAAFSQAVVRRYVQAVKESEWLSTTDLAMTNDWARANPHANPLEVTEAELIAAMTPETAEALELPASDEISAALQQYFVRHCSAEGNAAHAALQRGDVPLPPVDGRWEPTSNGCSLTRMGYTHSLTPYRARRLDCEGSRSAGSVVCDITFRWHCDPRGPVCSIISEFSTGKSRISLVVDPAAPGRGWVAERLVYEGEYEKPKAATPDIPTACDTLSGIPLTFNQLAVIGATGGCP